MAREQGSGLLKLLEAPVHLLYLSSVLCSGTAQLLQEMFIRTDQGTGGEKEINCGTPPSTQPAAVSQLPQLN